MAIIQRLIVAYKLWHRVKIHIDKLSRYTLAEKIDQLFIETLELLFIAQYLPKTQKLATLQKANGLFDLLKFFVMILWELNHIGIRQYATLSQKFNLIGIMLNKWLKYIENDTARPY